MPSSHLLDQVFVNSDLHCTIPFVRTCRRYEQWSTAEVRSGNGGMRAKWTQRTPTKRRTAMHAPSRPVADGRDGRERVTFTSARIGGKQQQVSQPKMACVLDTVISSHCGLSVVGKAFDVHPYAWTVLFQTAASKKTYRGHLQRFF